MNDQAFEALAALNDAGTLPDDATLELLRSKHLVAKRGDKVTGYGQTRLARWREGRKTGARTDAGKARETRVSAKGLEIARTLGFGAARRAGRWVVVNRWGQPVHVTGGHEGGFDSAQAAQAKADELNAERNAAVLAAA